MIRLLTAEQPMSVRQVFYRMTSLGVINKTEAEYKSTVGRLLVKLRRNGRIPYGWIADSTRWMRKPPSYSSLEQMLSRSAELYRRALWDSQQCYVEIWLEKDALAGVIYPITAEWDVPLMVCRGYPSLTFLHSAAEVIGAHRKPAYLYYFGDHDPSGVDIDRKVEKDLREMAPNAAIHFQRIAVQREQISDWNLPTRPTKKTDSRSRGFIGESVEVDAIPPDQLRDLVRSCIEQHVDYTALQRLDTVEAAERNTLHQLADYIRETN